MRTRPGRKQGLTMFLNDADYFTRRALTQLDRAASAADQGVARVHVRLSDLYLERARTIVERELSVGPEMISAG